MLSLLLQFSFAKRSGGRRGGATRRQGKGNRRRGTSGGTSNRAKKPTSTSTSNQKKRSGANFNSRTSTASKTSTNKIHKAGTYVIENKKEGKKYVGRSSDIQKRLKQHNSGTGAKWTSNSSGEWTIVKTYKGNDSTTEKKIMRGVMRNEGFENVRGGPYTKTHYSQHELKAIKNANEF